MGSGKDSKKRVAASKDKPSKHPGDRPKSADSKRVAERVPGTKAADERPATEKPSTKKPPAKKPPGKKASSKKLSGKELAAQKSVGKKPSAEKPAAAEEAYYTARHLLEALRNLDDEFLDMPLVLIHGKSLQKPNLVQGLIPAPTPVRRSAVDSKKTSLLTLGLLTGDQAG